MAKSQFLGPGAYVWVNGATTHVTSPFANPSSPATAYATALSNPLPVSGSFSFHWEPFVVPPWKYGGYAGLSVPIVSLPAETRSRSPLAQEAPVPDGPGDGLFVPHAPATRAATASTAAVLLMAVLLPGPG